LHLLQDELAFFQGQAEILDLRSVQVAPNNENHLSRQDAVGPGTFCPDPRFNCLLRWSCPIARKVPAYTTPASQGFFPFLAGRWPCQMSWR